MELPSYPEIEVAMVRVLAERGNKAMTARMAYDILGSDVFRLTAEQRKLQLETADGLEPAWENRCRTARNNLVKRGAMNAGPFDTWCLTEAAFRGYGKTPEELGLW